MNRTDEALNIVVAPIQIGINQCFALEVFLKEAIRGIIKAAPGRGFSEAAPDVEGLAHLVRVLIAADIHAHEAHNNTSVGFLRLQLMELTDLMEKHPGDPASACRRLGFVIAKALEHMGRADDETYPVPSIFRTAPLPA